MKKQLLLPQHHLAALDAHGPLVNLLCLAPVIVMIVMISVDIQKSFIDRHVIVIFKMFASEK